MAVVPVITLDGPSGVGKSTLGARLATKLGWHSLNSGALYRGLALALLQQGIAADNIAQIQAIGKHLAITFKWQPAQTAYAVYLAGQEVTAQLAMPECAAMASKIAALPQVRSLLLARQRDFAQSPGLIAEGRDMGTVVFPQAIVKCFLTASPEARAVRRQSQLLAAGETVDLAQLTKEMRARDTRDRQREIAPLVPADDALILDTTALTADQVYHQVLAKLETVDVFYQR